MKKIKNILSLSIVALCTFCLVGVYEVNAASATNWKVACDKQSLEAGDSANCYLLAQIEASGGQGIDGVITTLTTTASSQTKNVEIVGVSAAPQKLSSVAAELVNSGAKPQKEESNAKTNFTCNNNASEYPGCYIFYAKSGQSITPETNNGSINITGYSGYTAIGYYLVKLTNNATANDCGRLCVQVKYSAEGQYENANLSSGSAQPVCTEITPIGGENPSTGSFTSYVVLISGAFLALGAIVLVKKNNKFYKI